MIIGLFAKLVFYFVNEGAETAKLYLSFVDMFFVLSCIVCNPILGLIQDIPSKNQVFCTEEKIALHPQVNTWSVMVQECT